MTTSLAIERGKILEQASRAACFGGVIELRANDKTLAGADLDALLARAVARERVELELDVLAFEQGKRDADGNVLHNRNHVRFRDGAMMKLGRSGKGTPFMRDHNKWDSTAIGGRVLDSRAEKLDDIGHYQLRQTVRLTEPAAVERALRGLTQAVSIGWRPTGPVNCTACGTEVLSDCWHWPGDVVKAGDTEFVVEWEFTDAELVETSEVPIGGVPTAELEGIRAALSLAPQRSSPKGTDPMKDLRAALAAKLGLAGTASEDEILSAVNALDIDSKELAVAKKELAIVQAEQAIDRRSACDLFIRDALAVGKIKPSDEKAWRDLFELSADRAKARMAERPANVATLAGAPRQSDAPPPPEAEKPTGREEQTKKVLADHGVNYEQALKYAKAFGAKDPAAALTKSVLGEEN